MMAVFTDYYCLIHNGEAKSGTRVDCTASTESYQPFEAFRKQSGELFMYIGDNTHTKAGKDGKADLALTKTDHISSIYRPDITNDLGFGDVNHTSDALLFVFTDFSITNGRLSDGATVEIFVARGKRADRHNIYNLLVDGELDSEIEALRQRAKNQKPL